MFRDRVYNRDVVVVGWFLWVDATKLTLSSCLAGKARTRSSLAYLHTFLIDSLLQIDRAIGIMDWMHFYGGERPDIMQG